MSPARLAPEFGGEVLALGIVTLLCMAVLVLRVWRLANSLLRHGGGESPGDGEPDPMDLPGDGMSPYDIALRELSDQNDRLPR